MVCAHGGYTLISAQRCLRLLVWSLGLSIAGNVGATAWCAVNSTDPIIVIGAGVSGLTAARALDEGAALDPACARADCCLPQLGAM